MSLPVTMHWEHSMSSVISNQVAKHYEESVERLHIPWMDSHWSAHRSLPGLPYRIMHKEYLGLIESTMRQTKSFTCLSHVAVISFVGDTEQVACHFWAYLYNFSRCHSLQHLTLCRRLHSHNNEFGLGGSHIPGTKQSKYSVLFNILYEYGL